mgnify:CR=1 FL=1
MKCFICELSPRDGISLYRQNSKGQPGLWACREHTVVPTPAIVQEIVSIIERAG